MKEGDMRRTLIVMVAVVVLIACGAPRAVASELELEGTYTAKGFNVDGSEYHRVVRIIRRGESFLVAWMLPERVDEVIVPRTKSAGVGVVNGGMLAVSYYGQDVTGVILYQIEEGGQRLIGRWVTADGNGAVGSETLIKVPSSSAPATPDTSRQSPQTLRRDVAIQ